MYTALFLISAASFKSYRARPALIADYELAVYAQDDISGIAASFPGALMTVIIYESSYSTRCRTHAHTIVPSDVTILLPFPSLLPPPPLPSNLPENGVVLAERVFPRRRREKSIFI